MVSEINGPVQLLGQVTIGSHTLLVAAIMIMLGIQLLTFGVIARRAALRRGVLPSRARRHDLLRHVSLESLLVASVLLIAVGLGSLIVLAVLGRAGIINILHSEASLRALILSSCLTASGIQVAFSAFLLGMFDLPDNDVRGQMLRLHQAVKGS
jgi:hypothetical protein